MAALNNDSLNMPVANIAYDATILSQNNGGLVSTTLGGISVWSVVLTILLGLVLYDQGEFYNGDEQPGRAVGLTLEGSHVHLQKRIHRWPCMESPLHWTFP